MEALNYGCHRKEKNTLLLLSCPPLSHHCRSRHLQADTSPLPPPTAVVGERTAYVGGSSDQYGSILLLLGRMHLFVILIVAGHQLLRKKEERKNDGEPRGQATTNIIE